ncbi:hypothetical protein AALP_AAs69847U000300 [Arabis alpina]|uniref:DUF1204 domain-containing protein n=1 Tax=Arabis alpina TaxID=50452 RepID=A0A087FYT5_ARAAL|nr:hypothetical protein AALP_AAs69847U000300 [Arabis alpina]
MKSPVIVSSNSDSGSNTEDLEVSLAIDQSHQMRVSDKGGASSSRLVQADQVNDNRCAAIVSADGRDAERWNIIRDLSVEESEDQELEEQALPEFVEEVDGGDEAIDRALLARIPRAPGLSSDLFPGSSDDIASSSSYETIERIRGDDDWSGVDIRIPRPHERPWSPPEGFLCLYECYFNHGGMWFPIPKLALEYCEARRVAPSQLTCASYRNICAILTMAAELGRSVNLAQLEEMVEIAKSGDCGRFYASMRSGCMILTGVSSRIERWKNKYFFVRINKYVIGDFNGVIHAGWSSRIGRKLQVLEPVPKGAFSLIAELKKLGQQKWGDFIEQRIRRCRRRVTTGDYTIPLAKIGPYTHRPLKDRKKRPSKKQSSEVGSMGLEDLDFVVYNVGSGSAKAAASSDVRRKDKGIVIDDPSKKKVGADAPREPAAASKAVGGSAQRELAAASKAVGGSEARRSEKRKDREDDQRRSGSDPKKSRKEKKKDKSLAVADVANTELPEQRNAEEVVGDQTAVGATLSFGAGYDFNLQFAGQGRHILEDPVACGEYVRCIQGHPRGPVPESDEMVERDEFLAFSVDLTRMVSNVNFMRTRYEGMLQKNHELIVENRVLKLRMKNMTIAAEEKVGRILALEQKNEELKVEVAKWEDEVQSMMGEKQSIYHLAKSQMKRLRVSRRDTATNFGEYAIEKIKAFLSFYEEQGSAPEGAVERLQEDLEKYLKMAAAHDVEKISEEDLTFPDRASWIPGEELVFPIETPNRIGQYGLGEEWDFAGEEEAREDGSGSSHVSETDEDEDPLMVNDRAKVSKGPSEVAGTSTKADGRPSTTADPTANPDEAAERLGTDEVDVVNF